MSQQLHTAPRPTPLVPRRQLPRLRRELEQERCFRVDQIDELAAETAAASLVGDDARRHIGRALTVAAEWVLGDVEAALHRLDQGTYGLCECCQAPIPFERLDVLPMTRSCVPCQRDDAGQPASV